MDRVPIDSTEVLILQCPQCPFLSLRVQSLHEHLTEHQCSISIKLVKCKTCGTVTNSEKVMQEHISIWHPSPEAGEADGVAVIFDETYNSDKPAGGPYVSSQYTGGTTGGTNLPSINLQQLMNMACGPVELNLPGVYQLDRTKDGVYGKVRYLPSFLSKGVADGLLEALRQELPWKQLVSKTKEGEERKEPRLTCYMGPKYEYGGVSLENLEPLPAKLQELKGLVEQASGATFNSVLGVLYRQGKDSMGWHSDNEKELGPHPTIASVSLGQPRVFELMRKFREDRHIRVWLRHGDLLVTEGSVQELWRHRVPKDPTARRCRVNFTFRTVTPKEAEKPKSPGPVGSGKKKA